jgi:phosphatidylserine/phosphatidylglycerophosphate/cardiolipin synthase-like enzyme
MGQGNSKDPAPGTGVLADNPDRQVFVKLLSYQRHAGTFTTPVIYRYEIRYQRYMWVIEKRFHEIIALDNALHKEFPHLVSNVKRPPTYWLWTPDKAFFDKRAARVADFIQQLVDSKELFADAKKLRLFLDISTVSFTPEMGRKSLKEGYLKKSSGGYTEKFSRKLGDYVTYWRWRYFVLHDNCITWYRNPQSPTPQGSIQIDRDFHFHAVGRIIVVTTATRRIRLAAASIVEANSWMQAITEFYANTRRRYVQPFMSSAPVRENCDVRVYTYPRDYMASVAVAMLSAQQEIFITSWKNSPTVLVARPPLPPLRLDQILRYKAEQGVKIYILLYKEVEFAGQGNDSLKAKTYLESLSPNIYVIRHPNKIMGGSTAVMWSHHEKLVIVDRNMAFVGGIDLAFNRWDDDQKSLADEDGLRYPGKDYRQPAEGLFKPVRNPFVTTIGANGQVEVMMMDATVASATLPMASADVVTMASVFDHDAAEISPYTQPGASSMINVENMPAAGGPEQSQRVLSCDFGVMNLDRRTNNTVQSRQDRSNRSLLSGGGGSVPSSTRNLTGHYSPGHDEDASMHGVSPNQSHMHSYSNTPANRSRENTLTQMPPNGIYGTPGTTPRSVESKNGDAEGRLSMLEEHQERAAHMSNAEMAAFASKEEREDHLMNANNANAPTAPINAVAIMSSENQDIYNLEQPVTAAIAASDVTVVGGNQSEQAGGAAANGMPPSGMRMLFNAASDFVTQMREAVMDASKQPQRVMLRETHPRMPWQDLHSAVSGGPARDVASHFIQRWNHHRIATGNYDMASLVDTTDDTAFGVCARCQLEKVFETATHCPRCNLFLGPISPFLEDIRPDLIPETPESFSFITFECSFPGNPMCRFLGDCPVVITQLIPPAREEDFFCEGVLVEESGDMTSELFTLGLVPAVGDVIIAVNGHTVTQLDHLHLDRFIRRQQDLAMDAAENNMSSNSSANVQKQPLCVRFRRHYVADNFQGLKEEIMHASSVGAAAKDVAEAIEDDEESAKAAAAGGGVASSGSAVAAIPGNGDVRGLTRDSAIGDSKDDEVAVVVSPNNKRKSIQEVIQSGVRTANEAVDTTLRNANQAIDSTVDNINKRVENATVAATTAVNMLKAKIGGESLEMVCQLTASREIALSISKLYHLVSSLFMLGMSCMSFLILLLFFACSRIK